MTPIKKNQSKPVRLSLEQALGIVFLVEDLAGRKLTAAEDAILMPLAEQVQLIHAQMEAEYHPETPARDIPIRLRSVDKSR